MRPSPDWTRPPDAIASPPPGRARLAISALIAAWLLWQTLTPISYYLLREHIGDERFAWRMFSDVAVYGQKCAVTVTESGRYGTPDRPVDLGAALHGAWLVHMRVNRRLVIDQVLEWRCRLDPSVTAVAFRRTCPLGPEASQPVEAHLSCPGKSQ